MKKMFLASCLLAASVFAAPKAEDVKAAADQAKPAVEAKAATAKAKAKTAVKKKAATVKEKAAAAAPSEEVKAVAEQAKAPVAEAKAAVEAKATAADAKAAEVKAAEAKATEAKAAAAPVIIPALQPTPAPEAKAPEAAPVPVAIPAPVVEPAPAPAPVIPAPVAEVKAPEPAPVVAVPTEAPAEEVAAAEQQSTTSHKKKKMIENAVFTVNQIDFDINADFELQAGKVLWTSEDDDNMDNLETWNGQANFAVLAETNNFKGKIAMAFYPGDLKTDSDNHAISGAEDYFTLDEAWAYQSNGWFSFKVGRWDNTDKSGDYFGGYIDGYVNGFLSSQDAENQFEFGFVPNENIDFTLSFISKSQHLNKGDLRAVFNFHDLPSLELFEIQLGYRSNVFDKVNDSDADIKHNVSLKLRYPIVPDFFTVFGEVALMDVSDDMVVPLTGGIEFNFKTVDRVILEAEYVSDRYDHKDFIGKKTKHVKDVLGALYLEKALTDRFSLSAGFHNYASSRDFMISGDLIGRIN